MKKGGLSMFLVLVALSLFAQTQGRDKPASTQQPSEDLAALQTAYSLAKFGYSSRSASALLCAAEILAQVQKQPLESQGVQSQSSGTGQVNTPEYTPGNLLTDGKRYAAGDATMLAWAADIEKSLQVTTRGSIGGPKSGGGVLYGGQTTTYTAQYKANELAEIGLSGNEASDLDLYVYDANGNLIVFDEGYTVMPMSVLFPDGQVHLI